MVSVREVYSLERLRALHAVWRHGSLAAAAAVLHVTPSAVSQQLAKLERETGTALLVPHGRGVRLTTAADLLARRADRILAELHAARQDLDALGGEVVGPVHLGAIPSGVHTFIPTALTTLVAAHPGVEPTLAEAEPEQSLPLLTDGALDVAVVESWENLPLARTADTEWTPLLADTACVVLPLAHPCAAAPTVGLDELAGSDWVGWSRGSRSDEWLAQTLRERGIDPVVRYTVTGFSTQFAVVAMLGAAALAPSMATIVAPPSVRAVPLRPRLSRALFAVHARHRTRPAVAACLTALTEAANSWSPAALE